MIAQDAGFRRTAHACPPPFAEENNLPTVGTNKPPMHRSHSFLASSCLISVHQRSNHSSVYSGSLFILGTSWKNGFRRTGLGSDQRCRIGSIKHRSKTVALCRCIPTESAVCRQTYQQTQHCHTYQPARLVIHKNLYFQLSKRFLPSALIFRQNSREIFQTAAPQIP